jgi:hypothetical protein
MPLPTRTPRKAHVGDLTSDLADELAGPIGVRDEDGRTVRVSRQRAIIRAVVAAAVGGDIHAAALVLALSDRLLGAAGEAEEASPADRRLLEAFVEREVARRSSRTAGDDGDPNDIAHQD